MSLSIPPNDATKIQGKFDTRKFLIKKIRKIPYASSHCEPYI